MPVSDSGMKVKPSSLPSFARGEGPADCGVEVEVSGGGEVVCSVDKPLEGVVESAFWGSGRFVISGGIGELLS
jgi:hypothetical protein